MQVFRDYADWPVALKGAVVAIGNFDGVHRGHQAVLAQAKERANTHNKQLAVLTFEPHPRHFFRPDSPNLRLVSFAHKARLLHAQGVDAILAQRFNGAFSHLEAADFIAKVLVDAMAAHTVMTGRDFVFGHRRSGDVQTLAACDDFAYEAIAPVGSQAEGKFSSSQVRSHIQRGEMREAATILGRPYAWSGRVVHGDKRGRVIGFPTANMMPPPVLWPRTGVYAVCGACKGRMLAGVANWGSRPTVDGTRTLLEAHWFDMDDDLYGHRMQVDFIAHLRDEQRFDGVDALQRQIQMDCQQAREVLASQHAA